VTTPSGRDAVITALDNVTRAITDDLGPKVAALRADQDTLAAAQRRDRRRLALVIASLIIDIVVTVAVTISFVAAHRAEATVTELRATSIAACNLGNQARAEQVALWEHIATISKPPPHESPAARKRQAQVLTAFLAYIHRVFAPRDCAAIYRLP